MGKKKRVQLLHCLSLSTMRSRGPWSISAKTYVYSQTVENKKKVYMQKPFLLSSKLNACSLCICFSDSW